MTKLIKPVMIDNIIRSGVVLKSRKAYKEISKLELTNLCAVRAHDNRSGKPVNAEPTTCSISTNF